MMNIKVLVVTALGLLPVWKKGRQNRKVFFFSLNLLLDPDTSILDWCENVVTIQNEDREDKQSLASGKDHVQGQHYFVRPSVGLKQLGG